jgi:uncharacterized protein GlcG (DUF336 family)
MNSIRRDLLSHSLCQVAIAVLIVLGAAAPSCGGGDGGASSDQTSASSSSPPPPTPQPASTPAPSPSQNLTESDVTTIVIQAVNQATALGAPATIAVVDRVGNVLEVTQMAGAPPMATITSRTGVATTNLPPAMPVTVNGLEGVPVPTTLAAISKAVTGAYLSSSQGNAFSTRTANQIIQEHFDPGVAGTPSGPLFGVQFSQLPCSDFNTVAPTTAGATNVGPHRSPLGFAADSGGLPIYKNGILEGGIGVMSEATYSLNLNIFNVPIDNDEVIAIAGVAGYEAPSNITAPNIAVNGLTLQYTDATMANLAAPVNATGGFAPLTVTGFFPGPANGHAAIAGTTYGTPASGIVPDGTIGPVLYPGVTAFVFTDGNGNVLYPPTNGLVPGSGLAITASEAQQLMISALAVAMQTRAAIRVPLGSFAQVNVTIVDLDGNVLAQARLPDAPIFGADVSRQKARTAVFFSRPDAASTINAITIPSSTSFPTGTFAQYITASQNLVEPFVFADGFAWSEVALGSIARPFYPDGIDGNPPGSLSLPFGTRWSIFSTGIQTDLIVPDAVAAVVAVEQNNDNAAPPAAGCGSNPIPTIIPGVELPIVSGGKTQLANGMQIFSGGAPIYRGDILVGGIGVSGDGIQQDSLISFLGVQNGPDTLNNAPADIRADQLSAGGVRLRYVNCPPSPFLNSTVQNAC